MKMKLPILALSAILLVGLASCGTKKPTPTTSSVEQITVESVQITGYDDLTVLSGSELTLKAEVKASKDKLKVTWASSDETVAIVKNGKVKFAHAFGSHKFLHKRPDTKRKYRKAKIADDTNMAEMPRLMPYGG